MTPNNKAYLQATNKARIIEIVEAIEVAYSNDSNYFDGEIDGEPFKIRMNKDHARNGFRNDDSFVHNLSMINIKDYTCVGIKINGSGYVQQQVDNIADWQDAEEAILEFFSQIENK